MRLVALAADEVEIFVGLEVRHADDDLLRPEGDGQRCNTLDNLVHVETHRIGIAPAALGDLLLEVGRQLVVFKTGFRVNANHGADDEFQPRQPHTRVRQLCEIEGELRIAHVHHDLHRTCRHAVQRNIEHFEVQQAVVDIARIAFGAGYGDLPALGQHLGRIVATNNRGDTQLAGDDGRVAGASAAVGDDR